MALLIDVQIPSWYTNEEMYEIMRPLLPSADLRTPATLGDPADVVMIMGAYISGEMVRQLPNLKLMQKLGAGVNNIVDHPDLHADVLVARVKPESQAREIAEYCLAYVLREQRNMRFHDQYQQERQWVPRPPQDSTQATVGVLGLGHLGKRTAEMFAYMGFRVLGWSRTPKEIEGVDCRHGDDALQPLLGECDYVVILLPSTNATQNLFDATIFEAMKPGACIVNVGRGDLIVEEDLLAALNAGQVGHAVLDVVRKEPLPITNPLWVHPSVTITPHVSGWRITGAFEDVADNYRRLIEGRPLLHLVDRKAGY